MALLINKEDNSCCFQTTNDKNSQDSVNLILRTYYRGTINESEHFKTDVFVLFTFTPYSQWPINNHGRQLLMMQNNQ